MSKERVLGDCPVCGKPLVEIGACGVVHPEGLWDAETERFRCGGGHMIFVTHADRIEAAEKHVIGRILGTDIVIRPDTKPEEVERIMRAALEPLGMLQDFVRRDSVKVNFGEGDAPPKK